MRIKCDNERKKQSSDMHTACEQGPCLISSLLYLWCLEQGWKMEVLHLNKQINKYLLNELCINKLIRQKKAHRAIMIISMDKDSGS